MGSLLGEHLEALFRRAERENDSSKTRSQDVVAGTADGPHTAGARAMNVPDRSNRSPIPTRESAHILLETHENHEGERSGSAEAAEIAGDAELLERVREAGFAGPLYDSLINRLVRYGLAVLQAWILSGKVFELSSRNGRPVRVDTKQFRRLRSDPDEVNGIAIDTVATALERFDREALRGGGWEAARGTKLTTYFMGAVVQCFPNAYRKWASADAPEPVDATTDVERRSVDPAELLEGEQNREQLLSQLNQEQRIALEMTISGYSQIEIAEHLGKTERAVEGLMRRSRRTMGSGGVHE